MSGSSRSPVDPTLTRDVGQQSGTANGEASTTSTQSGPVLPNNAAFGDGLDALKQNPDMMRCARDQILPAVLPLYSLFHESLELSFNSS